MKTLRVWHIPQVPMKPFHVYVDTVQEAAKVIDVLARYDSFQYQNGIKPDYCNAQGLEEWDDKYGEWYEWYNEDGLNIKEYIEKFSEPPKN